MRLSFPMSMSVCLDKCKTLFGGGMEGSGEERRWVDTGPKRSSGTICLHTLMRFPVAQVSHAVPSLQALLEHPLVLCIRDTDSVQVAGIECSSLLSPWLCTVFLSAIHLS